jgi:tRNA threonylcarbamoyladenosine biosynthesis protein TsaE
MTASERERVGPGPVVTHSAAETEALGAELVGRLEAGDVVVVSGEVGAGKTTLIRGACRALGIGGPITSPTFTIGHRYEGGRMPVSHLDLYRLDDLEGEDPALLDDYIEAAGVAFIEWPALAEPQLAGRRVIAVRLAHAGGDSREIELPPHPPADRRVREERCM